MAVLLMVGWPPSCLVFQLDPVQLRLVHHRCPRTMELNVVALLARIVSFIIFSMCVCGYSCLDDLLMHLIMLLVDVMQIVQDVLGIDVHGNTEDVDDVDYRLGVATARAYPAFSEQQLYRGAEVIRRLNL